MKGKRRKPDVQAFQFNLMANLCQLHVDFKTKTYRHGPYHAFRLNDPKPRQIHKASVRDRVLHHAIYRQLYWPFHQKFIADSFSCRLGKGTHKALNRFRALAFKVSQNHTRTCWVLKCDIKKFFASVDQAILLQILRRWLPDENVIWLLERVIFSFHSGQPGGGLPLGNLTSQLLVNIYMNEFDQFIKQNLRIKPYLRYTDDFVVLSPDKKYLAELLPILARFLDNRLGLQLHPAKVFLKTFASGVDFLGWVHFPDHRVVRGATRRRLERRLAGPAVNGAALQSSLGLLSHGNTSKLTARIRRSGFRG